jgi:hypothetical protein
VAAGRALVRLACNGNAACEGQLELISRAAGAAAAGRKATVYGKSTYKIAANGQATVKVKLNRRGKQLLRKHRSAKIGLRMTPRGGTPITSRLTLQRGANAR